MLFTRNENTWLPLYLPINKKVIFLGYGKVAVTGIIKESLFMGTGSQSDGLAATCVEDLFAVDGQLKSVDVIDEMKVDENLIFIEKVDIHWKNPLAKLIFPFSSKDHRFKKKFGSNKVFFYDVARTINDIYSTQKSNYSREGFPWDVRCVGVGGPRDPGIHQATYDLMISVLNENSYLLDDRLLLTVSSSTKKSWSDEDKQFDKRLRNSVKWECLCRPEEIAVPNFIKNSRPLHSTFVTWKKKSPWYSFWFDLYGVEEEVDVGKKRNSEWVQPREDRKRKKLLSVSVVRKKNADDNVISQESTGLRSVPKPQAGAKTSRSVEERQVINNIPSTSINLPVIKDPAPPTNDVVIPINEVTKGSVDKKLMDGNLKIRVRMPRGKSTDDEERSVSTDAQGVNIGKEIVNEDVCDQNSADGNARNDIGEGTGDENEKDHVDNDSVDDKENDEVGDECNEEVNTSGLGGERCDDQNIVSELMGEERCDDSVIDEDDNQENNSDDARSLVDDDSNDVGDESNDDVGDKSNESDDKYNDKGADESNDAVGDDDVGDESNNEGGDETNDEVRDKYNDKGGNRSNDEVGDESGDDVGDESNDDVGDESNDEGGDETNEVRDESNDEGGAQSNDEEEVNVEQMDVEHSHDQSSDDDSVNSDIVYVTKERNQVNTISGPAPTGIGKLPWRSMLFNESDEENGSDGGSTSEQFKLIKLLEADYMEYLLEIDVNDIIFNSRKENIDEEHFNNVSRLLENGYQPTKGHIIVNISKKDLPRTLKPGILNKMTKSSIPIATIIDGLYRVGVIKVQLKMGFQQNPRIIVCLVVRKDGKILSQNEKVTFSARKQIAYLNQRPQTVSNVLEKTSKVCRYLYDRFPQIKQKSINWLCKEVSQIIISDGGQIQSIRSYVLIAKCCFGDRAKEKAIIRLVNEHDILRLTYIAQEHVLRESVHVISLFLNSIARAMDPAKKMVKKDNVRYKAKRGDKRNKLRRLPPSNSFLKGFVDDIVILLKMIVRLFEMLNLDESYLLIKVPCNCPNSKKKFDYSLLQYISDYTCEWIFERKEEDFGSILTLVLELYKDIMKKEITAKQEFETDMLIKQANVRGRVRIQAVKRRKRRNSNKEKADRSDDEYGMTSEDGTEAEKDGSGSNQIVLLNESEYNQGAQPPTKKSKLTRDGSAQDIDEAESQIDTENDGNMEDKSNENNGNVEKNGEKEDNAEKDDDNGKGDGDAEPTGDNVINQQGATNEEANDDGGEVSGAGSTVNDHDDPVGNSNGDGVAEGDGDTEVADDSVINENVGNKEKEVDHTHVVKKLDKSKSVGDQEETVNQDFRGKINEEEISIQQSNNYSFNNEDGTNEERDENTSDQENDQSIDPEKVTGSAERDDDANFNVKDQEAPQGSNLATESGKLAFTTRDGIYIIGSSDDVLFEDVDECSEKYRIGEKERKIQGCDEEPDMDKENVPSHQVDGFLTAEEIETLDMTVKKKHSERKLKLSLPQSVWPLPDIRSFKVRQWLKHMFIPSHHRINKICNFEMIQRTHSQLFSLASEGQLKSSNTFQELLEDSMTDDNVRRMIEAFGTNFFTLRKYELDKKGYTIMKGFCADRKVNCLSTTEDNVLSIKKLEEFVQDLPLMDDNNSLWERVCDAEGEDVVSLASESGGRLITSTYAVMEFMERNGDIWKQRAILDMGLGMLLAILQAGSVSKGKPCIYMPNTGGRFIKTMKNTSRQGTHCDFEVELVRKKKKITGYSAMVSGKSGFPLWIVEGSHIYVYEPVALRNKRKVKCRKVFVDPYSIIVFRGDLVHAGGSGKEQLLNGNTRYHVPFIPTSQTVYGKVHFISFPLTTYEN